jgi:hypothetical protein
MPDALFLIGKTTGSTEAPTVRSSSVAESSLTEVVRGLFRWAATVAERLIGEERVKEGLRVGEAFPALPLAVAARNRVLSQEVREHLDYLREVAAAPDRLAEPRTSALARAAWFILRREIGSLPVPAAGVGGGGEILHCWDRGDHHFELEVFPSEPAALFYRNRRTGETWGAKYVVGDPVPDEVIRRLKLF